MHVYVRVYTGHYLLRHTAMHYDDDDASSHAMMKMMMMTMVVTILMMMMTMVVVTILMMMMMMHLPSQLSIHSYNHDCSEDRRGSERQAIPAR